MTTFHKIIYHVIKIDNNIFSLNYDINDNINLIHKVFLHNLSNNAILKNYKNKFEYVQEAIFNNFYLFEKQQEKNKCFSLFCKIQQIYHILNKFIISYKVKKSKLIVDTDLQLNQITEKDKNVISIYHINSKYLFRIEDLLKIIYMSLTNNSSFFSKPLSIKNPYNNMPFGKSILYYIYYFLTSNATIKFLKSEYLFLFLKFKDCNFNITEFFYNYEYFLRECAIKNYINNSTKQTIVNDIKEMINSFNRKSLEKINISTNFPDNYLIQIMKPYLRIKLLSTYSLVKQKRYHAKKILFKKMQEFILFNPNFGKKTVKVTKDRNKRIKTHLEFNMKHTKFNIYENDDFMNNHLLLKTELTRELNQQNVDIFSQINNHQHESSSYDSDSYDNDSYDNDSYDSNNTNNTNSTNNIGYDNNFIYIYN